MRSQNAVLKDISEYYNRRSPRKKHPENFQLRYLISNLEAICDLNSFMAGYVYVIYLSENHRIRDIKRLNKDYLWPKDVESGVQEVVFFKRDRNSHEDDNEKISFLLQEKGIFAHSMIKVVDFVTCYNYRCRSLRKLIKN